MSKRNDLMGLACFCGAASLDTYARLLAREAAAPDAPRRSPDPDAPAPQAAKPKASAPGAPIRR